MAILLSCQPQKSANDLVFPYRVENPGPTDAYVVDAMPSVDPMTRKPRANGQAAVVMLDADGYASVGKFVPPMPIDRRIAVPLMPLTRRLPPGGAFENCMSLPLPLAETSPYFADLRLRQYDIVDIRGVAFTIGYWLVGSNVFAVRPVEYCADRFFVLPASDITPTIVSQRFPTIRLQLFRRGDKFPRRLSGAMQPEPESAFPE